MEEKTQEITIETKAVNEIIEIEENEEIINNNYDVEPIAEIEIEPKKEKKKGKWSTLTKKQKTIIIVCVVLLVLIVVGLLVYFLIIKKDDDNKPNQNEPMVIVEKDNYRYENGKLILIDSNKNELGKYTCENASESLCYVAYYSNEDEFDVAKKVYENGVPIDNRSDIFNNNYVFIYDNPKAEDGNVKLYNIDKKEVENTYELVKEIDGKKVIAKKGEKYGVISFENGITKDIEFKYDYLGYILASEYLVSSSNNNYKLIDFLGEDVSKSVPGKIRNYSSKNISVNINSKYYAYNYEGSKVLDKNFDYIAFVDDYFIAAESSKLFIYDKDGSVMNGEGIRISSDSYNTKLIFNEELRQTGKEEAFSAYVSGNTLRLEYDEDGLVNVNLNEGNYNKNMPFVNYFNGKLYFYSDKTKTNLIGSYQCNYANAVTEDTEVLENCFLAKESNILNPNDSNVKNGYLPIYNNRYVFITDVKSPNENNIILYDLKGTDKKKLATYKQVDAGYHNAEATIINLDTAGTLVTAKNASDSYGVVNITSSGVKGIVGFKNSDSENSWINTEIKVFNNYYLTKRNDGTYHLYSTKKANDEITSKITTKNEIVDYKDDYIKVKTDKNKYMIYGVLDGQIKSDEYNYIIMDSKVYIAVNSNNEVSVYKYNNRDNNLITSEVTVAGKDYANELKYYISGDVLTLTYVDGESNSIDINIG